MPLRYCICVLCRRKNEHCSLSSAGAILRRDRHFSSCNAFASDLPLPLTLTEAVKLALEKNPEIQQLQHRFRATEAKAKQAPYLEDPQIAFQLNGVPLSNPTSFNQSDWNSIGIRQTLPFFGKLGLKEKIAQREAKMAEQELRAKEREITIDGQNGLCRTFHGESIG